MADTPRHSRFEDTQAIVFGAVMCALSLAILQHLGYVTGGTAGIAVLLSYLTGWSFGVVFFVVNLPFYWFGFNQMGWGFTLKTFAAVALLSGFSAIAPQLLQFADIDPLAGAILAGATAGSGLMALFRHGASLGGVGIIAFYLQDKIGFRAGWTQLIIDAAIFAVAFMILPIDKVFYSLIGALVVNVMIAINHRRDHYIAY